MKITAETMQTYKIWHVTMLTAATLLKIFPIPQNEVPFMNTSEATEKVEWPNRGRQRGKRIRIFGSLSCDRSRADLSQLLN